MFSLKTILGLHSVFALIGSTSALPTSNSTSPPDNISDLSVPVAVSIPKITPDNKNVEVGLDYRVNKTHVHIKSCIAPYAQQDLHMCTLTWVHRVPDQLAQVYVYDHTCTNLNESPSYHWAESGELITETLSYRFLDVWTRTGHDDAHIEIRASKLPRVIYLRFNLNRYYGMSFIQDENNQFEYMYKRYDPNELGWKNGKDDPRWAEYGATEYPKPIDPTDRDPERSKESHYMVLRMPFRC